jgi:hypothetical protein
MRDAKVVRLLVKREPDVEYKLLGPGPAVLMREVKLPLEQTRGSWNVRRMSGRSDLVVWSSLRPSETEAIGNRLKIKQPLHTAVFTFDSCLQIASGKK